MTTLIQMMNVLSPLGIPSSKMSATRIGVTKSKIASNNLNAGPKIALPLYLFK